MIKFFRLAAIILTAYSNKMRPGGLLTLGVCGVGNQAIDAPNTTFSSGSTAPGVYTANADAGVLTTDVLTTAAAGTELIVLNNNTISAADITAGCRVYATILNYAGTGEPVLSRVEVAAGTLTFVIYNVAAVAAFNASMKISWQVGKAIV